MGQKICERCLRRPHDIDTFTTFLTTIDMQPATAIITKTRILVLDHQNRNERMLDVFHFCRGRKASSR
jgi:hypothetical protein